jgi:hypothetical protein
MRWRSGLFFFADAGSATPARTADPGRHRGRCVYQRYLEAGRGRSSTVGVTDAASRRTSLAGAVRHRRPVMMLTTLGGLGGARCTGGPARRRPSAAPMRRGNGIGAASAGRAGRGWGSGHGSVRDGRRPGLGLKGRTIAPGQDRLWRRAAGGRAGRDGKDRGSPQAGFWLPRAERRAWWQERAASPDFSETIRTEAAILPFDPRVSSGDTGPVRPSLAAR